MVRRLRAPRSARARAACGTRNGRADRTRPARPRSPLAPDPAPCRAPRPPRGDVRASCAPETGAHASPFAAPRTRREPVGPRRTLRTPGCNREARCFTLDRDVTRTRSRSLVQEHAARHRAGDPRARYRQLGDGHRANARARGRRAHSGVAADRRCTLACGPRRLEPGGDRDRAWAHGLLPRRRERRTTDDLRGAPPRDVCACAPPAAAGKTIVG